MGAKKKTRRVGSNHGRAQAGTETHGHGMQSSAYSIAQDTPCVNRPILRYTPSLEQRELFYNILQDHNIPCYVNEDGELAIPFLYATEALEVLDTFDPLSQVMLTMARGASDGC